jgi:hypothetical protein
VSTTVSDLIADTKRHLYGATTPDLNKLASSATTGQTSLTFAYSFSGPQMIRAGDYVQLKDEIVYVWATNATTQATVERAMLGSAAGSYVTNDLAEINARFPQVLIRNALQDEIRSWPKSVYKVATVDLTIASTESSADLTGLSTDIYGVLEVLVPPTSSTTDRWVEAPFREHFAFDTTDFASGMALFLGDGYARPSGAFDVRVTYAAPFDVDTMTDATTTATIGLTDTLLDIPPLGAASRLLAPQEISRSDAQSQGEARVANEVRPGQRFSAALGLMSLRDRRLAQEAERLLSKWGWRM